MHGPSPDNPHPMAGFPQVCYLKNIVTNPNIVVGDYTYYDDPEDTGNFERNVLYHFPFIGDKLIIGKFCALARGVKERFPAGVAAALQAIAWWDWPVGHITEHLALIAGGDVAALERVRPRP